MKTGQVLNQSRNSFVVAHQVGRADNPIARLCGLLGKKSLEAGHGIWFVPCASVHSLFMQFDFDVAFLDKQGRVLRIFERVRPWLLMTPYVKGAHIALELEAGAFAQAGVQVGDVLVWEKNI
jgi:uncharacterized membrane protein (UPF0127 family)